MLDRSRAAHLAVMALCMLGLATGLASAWLGWAGPSFSRWATSPVALALGVAAGWSLILVGRSAWMRTRATAAVRMVAAGGAWSLPEWINPDSAPSIVFTIGLLLGSLWPALLAHAALEWPDRQERRSAPRWLLAVAYISSLVFLGILPAIAFDPAASGCGLCPPSLLSVTPDPALVSWTTRVGLALQIMWAAAAAWLLVREMWRKPEARRGSVVLVRLPVAVVLLAVAADALYALSRGFRSNGGLDMAIWLVEAGGLVALGAASTIVYMRVRRTRRSVARLALDLASAPPAGELGRELGRLLDDPGLEVVYPLDAGALVDAAGDPVTLPVGSERATTTVLRGGVPVAHLIHRVELGQHEARVADAVATARLGLENERLQALSQARLRELRNSRAKIVAAADSERRRLERDLHDGSQQRLLGLAIELAIARQRAPVERGQMNVADHEYLEAQVREALADLRRLAHGIYPRTLADDGLAAALEELAESAPIPVDLLAVPNGRLDPRIEAAAYLVAALGIARPTAGRASVEARQVGDRLVVEVVADGAGSTEIADLEDRVGALDGTVTMGPSADGRILLRAEIPCVS